MVSRRVVVERSIRTPWNMEANLILFNDPWERPAVTDAHAAKDGDRDTQARLAQPAVFDLGVGQRLLEEGRKLFGSHICGAVNLVIGGCECCA